MKNRSVLVTGATGFVGAHLIATLIKNGYTNITAIIRSEASLHKLQYILNLHNIASFDNYLTIVKGELNDYQFLKEHFTGISVVFHTAAIVSFTKGREREVISQNVHITECCTEAAMECGVDRFVHVSSIAALHTPIYPELSNENSIISNLQSKSAYGISKFLSENVVRKAQTRGLNCTIVLPAVILGEGDTKYGGSPKLLKLYSTKQPFYTDGIIGYVGVEDVARALMIISEKDKAKGERYILCSENLSFYDIFTICSGNSPKYKLPELVLNTLKQIINLINKIGISTQLSGSTLDTLQEKCAYDGTKITKELNFDYTPIKNIKK